MAFIENTKDTIIDLTAPQVTAHITPFITPTEDVISKIKALFTKYNGQYLSENWAFGKQQYKHFAFSIAQGDLLKLKIELENSDKNSDFIRAMYSEVNNQFEYKNSRYRVKDVNAYINLLKSYHRKGGYKENDLVWVYDDTGQVMPGIVKMFQVVPNDTPIVLKPDATNRAIQTGFNIALTAASLPLGIATAITMPIFMSFVTSLFSSDKHYYVKAYAIELPDGRQVPAFDGSEEPFLKNAYHILIRDLPQNFDTILTKVKQYSSNPFIANIMDVYKVVLTKGQLDIIDNTIVEINKPKQTETSTVTPIPQPTNISNGEANLPIKPIELVPTAAQIQQVPQQVVQQDLLVYYNQLPKNQQYLILAGAGLALLFLFL